MSPNMVFDRGKVDDIGTIFIFWDFRKCTGKRRKWIYWFLFGTIFQVHIKLNNIERVMSNANITYPKWSWGNLTIFYFNEFNIAIMSIQLTREKSCKVFLCREKKSDLSSCGNHLKSKGRMYLFFPNLPPWTSMFDRMMKGRKHLTRDKYALFIGTVDRYFVGDEILSGHFFGYCFCHSGFILVVSTPEWVNLSLDTFSHKSI